MSIDITLSGILQELRNQSVPPLAIHVSGTVTYVVYGVTTINNIAAMTGYPVLRVTDVTASHTHIDKGFLLESDRAAGANGAAADTNLKTDSVNTLLLLTNPTLIYG
jgi:hypothetical protein